MFTSFQSNSDFVPQSIAWYGVPVAYVSAKDPWLDPQLMEFLSGYFTPEETKELDSWTEMFYEAEQSSADSLIHSSRADMGFDWTEEDDALCEAWLGASKMQVVASEVPVHLRCNVPGCSKARVNGPRCYECQQAVPPCPGVLGNPCTFTKGNGRPMNAFDAQPGSVCNCCFRSLTPHQQAELRDHQFRLRRLK